jgi:hypothetical protein
VTLKNEETIKFIFSEKNEQIFEPPEKKTQFPFTRKKQNLVSFLARPVFLL